MKLKMKLKKNNVCCALASLMLLFISFCVPPPVVATVEGIAVVVPILHII